jgi:DNA-binding transcriptional regulator YiaG
MTMLTPSRIKEARLALGLSQSKFAAEVGCNPLTVSFWERGVQEPKGLYAKAVEDVVRRAELRTIAAEVGSD